MNNTSTKIYKHVGLQYANEHLLDKLLTTFIAISCQHCYYT